MYVALDRLKTDEVADVVQITKARVLIAWQHYVRGLCERISPQKRDALRREVLRNVRKAAESSGGLLGLGKISRQEKLVLAKLESSFSMEYNAFRPFKR